MKIVIFTLIGFLIAFFGFLIKEKKHYELIAGYSSLRQEQKEQYNISWIAKVLGIYCYFLGIIFLILGVILQLIPIKIEYLFSLIWIFFIVSIDFVLLLINKQKITKFLILILLASNLFFIGLLLIYLFVL